MRLQHDTFTCQKCNATLNATSGEVNIPDTSEVVAIYTMCEYCGAIYQGSTTLQEARAGAKIGWTYLPDDQVPDYLKESAALVKEKLQRVAKRQSFPKAWRSTLRDTYLEIIGQPSPR